MKNILLFIFLFFTKILFAQEDFGQKVAYKLFEYSQNNRVEKVFLQLDKPNYSSGENIFFKAYLVEGVKNKLDTASKILYCDLIEKNSGLLLQKQTCFLSDGLSEGFLKIPDTLLSGKYTLRAYTNWMKNFDENYFFRQNIDILNTQKTFLSINLPYDFTLNFFPESGKIVEDVQTKIAFQFSENQKQNTDIQGFILGKKGDTITTFTSEKFGMGFFRLKPKANEKYTARLTSNGKTKYFPLPTVEHFGHILSIDNLTSMETISLSIKSKLPENELGKPMTVIAQSRGNFAFLGRFNTSNQKTVLTIPRAMFSDGIINFTIFDAKGTPFSERIIYNNAPNSLNISLLVEKEKAQNILLINVNDRDGRPIDANLSLAICDSAKVSEDIFAQNISSYFTLVSDLKDEVLSPSYYFDRSNPSAAKHLDLLMMTQSWTRFSWKNILEDKKKNHVFSTEKSILQVEKLAKNQEKSSTTLWQPSIITKNGGAKITLPDLKKGTTYTITVQGKNQNGALDFERIRYK